MRSEKPNGPVAGAAVSTEMSQSLTRSGKSQAGSRSTTTSWARPVLILACLVACSTSQRTQTLDAAYTATMAAGSAFLAYDGAKQLDIVAKAPDKATADAQLAAYRAEQTKVVQVFAATYQALATAYKVNTDASVATAIAAATALAAELKQDGIQ